MNRVLILDDEPNVLKSMERALRSAPCLWEGQHYRLEIVCFTNPFLALEYVKTHVLALIISDYRMPQMDGVDFLKDCLALQPDAPRFILSGYADLAGLVGAINQAKIYHFIAKPWDDAALKELVAKALANRQQLLDNKHLADQARWMQTGLSDAELEIRRLELEEPGITRVERDQDGAIRLDDEP